MSGIDYLTVSDKPLDSEDTRDVLEELGPIRRKASNIGTALGLALDSFDSEPTPESVVRTWLNQDYDTERHGEPTYRRLVKAVSSTAGGQNPAQAKKIAAKHPAKNNSKRHIADDSAPEQKRLKALDEGKTGQSFMDLELEKENISSADLLDSQATVSLDESDGMELLEQDKGNNSKRHHFADHSAPEQKRPKASDEDLLNSQATVSLDGSEQDKGNNSKRHYFADDSSPKQKDLKAAHSVEEKRNSSESQSSLVIIDGIPVDVPRVDTCLAGKPGFKNKTISAATRIHEFSQQMNDKQLLYLARSNLQDDIWKWEKQQSRRTAAAKQTKMSQDISNDRDQKRSKQKERKEMPAKEYYEQTHKESNVEVTIKDQLLTDSKEQITGKVFYQLQRHAAPVGFLHIEMVPSNKFKADLDKHDKLYYRIQTLLYAGQKKGFHHCDFVCYGPESEERFYKRVTADEDWQRTVAQRAHQYCDYYDQLWEITQQRYPVNPD